MPRNKDSRLSLVSKVCDSPTAKVIGLASGVIGILLFLGSFLHHQQDGAKNAASLTVPVALLAGPSITPMPRPKPRSVVQSSSGSQSPNISGVQHDVQIQYGGADVGAPDGLSANKQAATSPRAGSASSTIQTSRGAQSPNIANVRGSVDIRYGAAAPGSEKKLPEAQ
jgi:hypothetical protein